ncbi:hypothetical protein E6P97_03920 [Patescibacteria group bacterium]|nr:MAG: hypothetical protein E6P97_03920 [Patescibacteria group bacterium]
MKAWPKGVQFGLLLVLILALSTAGTLGYAKYKEESLQAKAAATLVPRTAASKDAQFAMCKVKKGARTFVRGIVARRYVNSRTPAYLITYSEGSAGRPGAKYTEVSTGGAWWGGVVAATEAPVPEKGWARLWYVGNESATMFMGFVPWC